MELKEAILQTLAEIDASQTQTNLPNQINSPQQEAKQEREALLDILPTEENLHKNSLDSQNPYERKIEKLDLKNTEELKQILIKQYKEEERFLNAMQERILVLFEGLQSPNNRNIEDKVDMILNFLEFTLAIIDEKKNQK
ncbi:hypothetical protein HPMG_01304 [Helicobacter pullorum MIT 98-5489]|uniref:Campylobacter invasion antigen D C-terminal domain-containing protein n=1 Tax=Helicobacter pullorum MIT 98-5489 TaxID=537972 RepID=C5F0U3_9HELI|nr:hypothetical protein [Helicobacter pullorum]EEQ63847.1 hypothetical protein HPMG_01304 [Helicobacter pullorum MIT 98-5489]HIS08513.1 hypothetical protein [Candidatus Scatomorpha intestinipullorum]HJF83711.1 hypothetical protein [Helicobacter pullorum]